jgi:hypothetical protein
MGNKIGDLPTVELGKEELARYAREVDKRAQESDDVSRRSTRRPAPGGAEPDISIDVDMDGEVVAQGPDVTAVPYVVASKEDLSWFELEEASSLILSQIDGNATVEAIIALLALQQDNALAVFRELQAHGVIEFR